MAGSGEPTPKVGTRYWCLTKTIARQTVMVEITKVIERLTDGWLVEGRRQRYSKKEKQDTREYLLEHDELMAVAALESKWEGS